MFLRIDKPLSIDNFKNYPMEVVQQLEELLVSGVEARLDPNRKNFYEVDHTDRVFFIHVQPYRRKAMLLATWLTELSIPAMALEERL